MKLIWITDLHLDRATTSARTQFLNLLASAQYDAAVITGDISNAANVSADLLELGRACGERKVYFVLGNHDFYGSSFATVDAAVAKVCSQQKNLCHLGSGEVIRLGNDTALVGHRGWADARAGSGADSPLHNPDADCIEDFHGLSSKARFGKMEELGKTSARYFREVLPYAMSCHRHVYLATHVPPFVEAVTFNGRPCGPYHRPFFTNVSAGGVISGVSKTARRSRMTVLCGHTHSAAVYSASQTLEARTGHSIPGKPGIQTIFNLN